jgi:hypothetical protein
MRGRFARVAALVLAACTPAAEPSTPPPPVDVAPTPAPVSAAADAPAGDSSGASEPLSSEPPPPAMRDDLYLAPKAGALVRIPDTGAAVHTVAAVAGPVWALAADRERRVYAAGRDGVHVIEEGVVTRTLPSVDVGLGRALHVGSERDVWYVGFGGVAHFDGDAWATTPAAELGLQYPSDVTVDAQGRAWVLAFRGVVRRDGERFSPVALLPDAWLFQGFVDAPGHELSIVHAAGIDHYDDEGWTKADLGFVVGAHVPTGRTLGTIAAAYGGGAITVASPGSVTTSRAPSRRFYEVRDEKHPVTELRGVEVDGRGRSWVITDGGLLLLDPDGFDPTWIGPGAIAGVEGEVAQILALGQGPPLPPLVDPGRGSVTGRLRHRGQPLAGARIALCSFPGLGGSKGHPCEFADHIYGTITAADGTFEVEDVPPGRYRMAAYVESKGWRYLSVEECCLAVRPGKPQDLGRIDTKTGDAKGW